MNTFRLLTVFKNAPCTHDTAYFRDYFNVLLIMHKKIDKKTNPLHYVHNLPNSRSMNMNGIGYCRRSIEDEKSHSIEYQVSAIEKLAESHNISLVGIEIDNGISGKFAKNRPGLQKVIKAVNEGLIQSVLVFKSDRISRNGIESIGIEKLFRDHEIRYLSVTEGILSGNSIEDSFMSFLRGGLNERERLLQSCRVKYALQKKREKNERLGSQPRYGYYVKNHQLIENPLEQRLVGRIKELRSSGLTTRKIAQQLSNEGFKTRKNTNFSQTQVCRILAGQ